MSRDPVEEFFSGLEQEEPEKYPGSRHTRRAKPLAPTQQVGDPTWDRNGYVRLVKGHYVELFPIGALSKALRRHPNSIRNWTRLGYIPHAPFRLPSYERDGETVPGRRLYSRQMVEAIIELFAERDLLNSERVEWNRYPELPRLIKEAWDKIYFELSDNQQGG